MIRKLQVKSIKFSFANFNKDKDYYKILGLTRTASQAEIKKSYLKYAKIYHPDTNKGKQDKFKEINEAYQVLSSELDKRDYDEARNPSRSSDQNNYQGYRSQTDYRYQQPQYGRNYSRGANPNTYRGYQKDESWESAAFRQKYMDDLLRGKYAQGHRYHGARMSQQDFDQMLKQRSNRNKSFGQMYDEFDENLRRKSEQMRATKISREQIEKAIRQEEQRRKRQYQQYQEKERIDLQKELKEKVKQMAQGFKNNVEGAYRIGKYMKSLWDDVTKNKK